MRVCHIASGDLWAGAEVQVWTLLSFLRGQGGVEVSAVLLNEGELARRLRSAGVNVIVLDETRLTAAAILALLVRTLRRLRPDVVHTHRYKENILGGLAAAAVGVRAAVCTVHGLTERYTGFARARMALYSWLDRRVVNWRRPTVVAVSRDMERTLAATYRAPVCFIPNAIDVAAYGEDGPWLPPTLGLREDDLVIGSLGRLVPVKGYDILLRAAPRMVARVPNLKILLVGDGPQRPRLASLARDLGIAAHVLLPGHCADVRPYLRRMDVFVLPSLAEGLPLALLEAMAAGRPVVVTRVGGMPEVVSDGEEGLLVAPQSEEALAAACLRLLGDPVLRAACGRKGRVRVAGALAIDSIGQHYLELYRRLLT